MPGGTISPSLRSTRKRSASFVPAIPSTTRPRQNHHGSGPSSFENVPVGPFASRSARRTGSRAACSTVRTLEELDFFSRELRILGVYPAHPFRVETQNGR